VTFSVAAIIALSTPASFTPEAAVAIPVGVLLALVALELPQIISVATFHRSWMGET
jgi:hypothetical protein